MSELGLVLTTTDYILLVIAVVLVVWSLINLLTAPSKKIEDKVDSTETEAEKRIEPQETWSDRLNKGLSSSRQNVWGKISGILSQKKLDDEVVEELEEILYTSDLSPALVAELMDKLEESKEEISPKEQIKGFLKDKMLPAQEKVNNALYDFNKTEEKKTQVIMVIGVNGAGKTTTIGKLATKLKNQGAKVVVGACDTFRAAAVEQLEVWCKRADVEIVKAAEGADPSGVAFDAVKKANNEGADYCIIDTAGRLHTKSNLMDELAKTKKVMSKIIPEAPHHTLLVVDAITGQNAMRQAEEFNKSLQLNGLVFTKCDGSSKAGSAVTIVDKLQVPIVYIGVGERVEDLDKFELNSFIDALVG